MRLLIGFVGTGDYIEVKYFLNGKECKDRYPFACLYNWFSPDKVYIISTQKGLNKHREAIKKRIPPVEFLEILTPKNERDIWEIYNRVREKIEMGDEIILDITFSFRHIPFMLYSTLLYMMEMKNVNVIGIYYGALEAGEDKDGEKKVPIFNVTGSLRVVEWLYAMNDMDKYGRGERIQTLTKRFKRERALQGDKNLPRYGFLDKIAGNIETISRSLYLNQNIDALRSAYSLKKQISEHEEDMEYVMREYPPIQDLKNIIKNIGDLSASNLSEVNGEILSKLLGLADYQRKIGLIGEALETLREWLVSYVIWICNINRRGWLKREVREDAEKAMGLIKKEFLKENTNDLERTNHYYQLKKILPKLPIKLSDLASLWDDVAQLRNKIAHAGMSEDRIEHRNINMKIEKLMESYRILIEGVKK